MELFVKWEDKYSVGIEKIDNQHKKLIEIINRLYYSRGNRPHAVLGKTIQELIEYTKTHFTDEERLMRGNGYPDYQAHKKRHEAFIEDSDSYKMFKQKRKIIELQKERIRLLEKEVELLKQAFDSGSLTASQT